MSKELTFQTPLEELKCNALNHYEEVSNKGMYWCSSVPSAINFYFDYKQMNVWQKIKLAFKKYKS